MNRHIPSPQDSVPTPQALEQERAEYMLAKEQLQTLSPEGRLKIQLAEGLRSHIVENGGSTESPVTIELSWQNLKAAGGEPAIEAALTDSGWQIASYNQGSGDNDVHNLHWAPTRVTLERAPSA
jgi:hypothetical protein